VPHRVPVRPNRVSSRSSVDRSRTASRETTGVVFGNITDCSKTSHLGHRPPLWRKAVSYAAPYCWVAMEYIAGENMTEVIDRIGVAGMLDWRYAFKVAVHVARALDYAHGKQIIHRNVAPKNILLETPTKTVKLGDLMLAKTLEGSLAQKITKPGEVVGDVAYMSPERTRGTDDVDGRSDLYGLGATVYALLTGRPPFTIKAKGRRAQPRPLSTN
jgi:serine/threonine protein kinase